MKYLKIILIGFIVLLISVATLYATFEVSKLRNFQFFGGLISRINTDQKVVALTFDDAPTEQTLGVLKVLKEHNIKATFYVVGSALEKYPEIGKQIAAEGHELGNHSYSHQRFLLKSQAFIKSEVETTDALIRQTGYSGEITFRPPNGKKLIGLPWYLSRNDRKTIMWDVEPDTYYSGDAMAITRYTIEKTKPGSIILLHPFCDAQCAADREALPKIIEGLKNSGFRFVTISDLLKQ